MTFLNRIASLAGDPMEHVREHRIFEIDADLGGLLTPEGKLTVLSDQIAMILLAGLLLLLFLPRAVRRRRGTDEVGRLVPTGSANAIEAVCQYLRDEMARPALEGHTDRFIKYIWTVFFFILTMNLLGLIPLGSWTPLAGLHLGGTATSNIWVTGTLAVISGVMMVANGIRLGGKDYILHLFPGPWWIAWLTGSIELIGLIAKPFALAVRLFANMLAGHVLLAVLLGFMVTAGSGIAATVLHGDGGVGGVLISAGVILASLAGSLFVNLLEIFVAFLQAFIFTFLTTLFIGMSIVFHHDGEGAEAHAH